MEIAHPLVEYPYPLPPERPRTRQQILEDALKPEEDTSLFEFCAALDAGFIDPSLLMALDYGEIGNFEIPRESARPTPPGPPPPDIEAVSEPDEDVMGEGFGVLRNSEIAAIDADLVDPSLVMGEGFGELGDCEIAGMDVDNADPSLVLGEGVGQLGNSEFPNKFADDFDDLDIN